MPTETYRSLLLREFRELKKLADDAMAQLDDRAFLAAPGPEDNSIAIIVKHVSGNLRSRWTDFLTSDGEKPDRDRDSEFLLFPHDTRARLMAAWESGWRTLFAALEPLGESDFTRPVKIRGETLTVLQAVNRQLTHYAYHVGQIVYVAKHLRGAAWKSLSIPKGQSEQFNRSGRKYIEPV
jgi:hypothetical protein